MRIKQNLFHLLMGGGFLLIMMSGALAHAEQTCNPSFNTNAPSQRFTDNHDGTLTDAHNDLMWKKCLEGQNGVSCYGNAKAMPWETAIQQARSANQRKFSGYSGWRLPTLDELSSLVNRSCSTPPTSDLKIFPHMLPVGVWSSEQSGANAWSVNFNYGRIYEVFKAGGKYVRLVRDL